MGFCSQEDGLDAKIGALHIYEKESPRSWGSTAMCGRRERVPAIGDRVFMKKRLERVIGEHYARTYALISG